MYSHLGWLMKCPQRDSSFEDKNILKVQLKKQSNYETT